MKYPPWLFRVVWLLVVQWFVVIKGDNCCGSSDCSASCPWTGSCDNGNDYPCMRQVSAGLACRDETACPDYDSCDEEEAAYRTGQLCRGFPWYNGGYPFDKVLFNKNYKMYNCTQPSANGLFCSNFSSLDDSLDNLKLGQSSCIEASSNGEYCQQWEIVQSRYKKCWLGWVNSDNGLVQQNVCCNRDNHQSLHCCDNTCDKSYYSAYPPRIDYLNCTCREASDNARYCQLWTCEQFSWPSQSYAEGREYETYTCLEADPVENHCRRWKGNVESIEEFEVDKCYCNTVVQSGQYCQDWVCEGIGANMWYPNLYWTVLGVLPGGIGHAIFMFILIDGKWTGLVTDFKTLRFYFMLSLGIFLVWDGGFILIGVWQAGFGVFLISGSILLSIMLAIFMYALWHVYESDRLLNPRSVHTARKCCLVRICSNMCNSDPPIVIVNDDFTPRDRNIPYNSYQHVDKEEEVSTREVELQIVVQDLSE